MGVFMSTFRRLLVATLVVSPAIAMADPPPAFTVCKQCHKIEAGMNSIGPSLAGVVGRKAGTGAGFAYSDAMKNSGLTWDDATLTKYLADPKATVPGTKMVFPGVKKAEDVPTLIDFLKTLK